jgi:hypothetical protein
LKEFRTDCTIIRGGLETFRGGFAPCRAAVIVGGRIGIDTGGNFSFLFSYVNDGHESLLAARLRQALPELLIFISSEVAPIWRAFERGNTTSMDAYVKPIVGEFVVLLNDGLDERRIHGWRALMKSNGGQVALAERMKRCPWGLFGGEPSSLTNLEVKCSTDEELVAHDVLERFVSAESAMCKYGVILAEGGKVDVRATEQRREEMRHAVEAAR